MTLLVLFACGSAAPSTKDGDDTADDTAPGDDTGDVTGVYVAGESPEILAVSMSTCLADPDGVDSWRVAVAVSDPQDDVAAQGSTVEILDGGESVGAFDLACSSTECSGSWQATDEGGIDCDVGDDVIFRFVVWDEAGHPSLPYDYTATD